MSEFVPRDSAKVVIGVCGEQGSGKTVFLTCIFQSIWTAFPDDVVLDFERKEIGNANYFQSIEDSIIAKGPTQGTTDKSLFPARIFIKPYEPLTGGNNVVLSVDLLDFAGRHFRLMADLKDLLDANESDTDDIKALREVNETLERADAFIILINSTEIDPLDETPKRNPFSPSVNFMLSHCRAERKPVALLFSQIDQTPRLDEELFHTLPRVEIFERQFTSDLQETLQGKRPFGIARRISCYETVSGDLAPRRQTMDGSIWRLEPAQIVLELLRAAMPRINERLAKEAEEAERLKREQDAISRAEERDRELAEIRRRKRQRTLRFAAVLGTILILGALAFAWFKRSENYEVRLLRSMESSLREGKIASIPQASQTEIGGILAQDQAGTGRTPASVRSAIGDLETALEGAAQHLASEPMLDAAYLTEITRLQNLIPLFNPAVTRAWQERLMPLLIARSEFLSDWFGKQRSERRERTTLLDESSKRFAKSGDNVFAGLLSAQSTREKEAEVASWQTQINADADVASRIATIQSLLASTADENDMEFKRLARRSLGEQLVLAILHRQENSFIREKLLTPLTPDLAKLEDGEVRFEVLARDLLACADEEECANRQGAVQSAITDARTATASWSAGVDNLLRSLLLDLPIEERGEVWRAIADSLSSAYLFSAREDAWPEGLRSLAATMRPAIGAENDFTEALIERLAQHPIYEGELLYLGDRLTALVSSRQVVHIYSDLLSTLKEERSLLETGGLTGADQRVSEVLADRADLTTGPLVDIGREIENVLALTESVNEQRTRGFGDTSVEENLERLLRNAKRGHCAVLESHQAPTECADAA